MTPGEMLSYCPLLRKRDGCLVASSSWLFRLLTLGLLLRQVVVDPKKKIICIRRRVFWLFASTRKIPFRFVQSVTYGYEGQREASWASEDYSVSGTFAVGLKLVDGERVHLLLFPGEGSQYPNMLADL